MSTLQPGKTRGEGQWAMGNHLKHGFDSIDKSDLRGRFRWMGLYTQREQGYDGSWTGEEHTEIFEAKHFMMRVRSDGKAMSVAAMRTLGRLNAIGVAPIAGRVSGLVLSSVAELIERSGSDRARFTPYQKLVILDVPDDMLDSMITGLDALGLPSRPSAWRKNLMACSGIEFCKPSFAETRFRAQTLVPELEQRLADINTELTIPITVNLNGCPNSCARIQVAAIGFKGQMVDDAKGGSVEGFQVHLGGGVGRDSGFGRKLRQHKVTSDELADYIDRVVRNFLRQRRHQERLSTWALRASEADLR